MIDNDGFLTNPPTAYDPNAIVVFPDKTMPIGEIITHLNSLESYKSKVFENRTKVQNLEDTLKQYLDDEEIEEDVATEIAKIFGISLDKTIEVTVNVEFTLSMVVPRDADLDDVIGNLSFNVDSYDADVESEDFSIVDWNESKGW
jgi:hypothetical protein